MQSRLHFMGNGYAGQLLDLIRNGRSVNTLMSVYDFMVLKSQIGSLDGAIFNGTELTISTGRESFVTNITTTHRLANGNMQFTDRYSSLAYLLYDEVLENGYLVTENDELLLI